MFIHIELVSILVIPDSYQFFEDWESVTGCHDSKIVGLWIVLNGGSTKVAVWLAVVSVSVIIKGFHQRIFKWNDPLLFWHIRSKYELLDFDSCAIVFGLLSKFRINQFDHSTALPFFPSLSSSNSFRVQSLWSFLSRAKSSSQDARQRHEFSDFISNSYS